MLAIAGIALAVLVLLAVARGHAEPQQRKKLLIPMTLAVIVIGACLIGRCLVAVPAGHVGVPVLFGRVIDNTLTEGLNLTNPLVSVEMMSIRSEAYTMSKHSARPENVAAASEAIESLMGGDNANVNDGPITAISKDGLQLTLDVTIIYRLAADDAPWVFRNLSRNYAANILQPAVRTAVREAAAHYSSQEAYASKREELAGKMQDQVIERFRKTMSDYADFKGQGVIIQQVLLRDVVLPQAVQDAINQKLAAEQESQRMEFVLKRETQDAERKRIEAQGVADAQKIVAGGLSDQLLRFRGIQATEELAKSPNAKIVVIGGGKDGLPIMLNMEK